MCPRGHRTRGLLCVGLCVLPDFWAVCLVPPYHKQPYGITCRSLRLVKLIVWSLVMARAQWSFSYRSGSTLPLGGIADPQQLQQWCHLIPHLCLASLLALDSYVTSVSKSLTNFTGKDSEGVISCPFFVPKCHMTVSNLHQISYVDDGQPKWWSARIPNEKAKKLFTSHTDYL